MDEWKKFNERLPGKEEFYSNVSMEDNTGADRMHAKRVVKTLGEYHDLYLRSGTLLFADVFENYRKTCLNMYHLDPVKFLSVSAPGLAWQATLKTTEVKLELLTDIDILLMVAKGISGGICHVISSIWKS